jgi:hypothetical protein
MLLYTAGFFSYVLVSYGYMKNKFEYTCNQCNHMRKYYHVATRNLSNIAYICSNKTMASYEPSGKTQNSNNTSKPQTNPSKQKQQNKEKKKLTKKTPPTQPSHTPEK